MPAPQPGSSRSGTTDPPDAFDRAAADYGELAGHLWNPLAEATLDAARPRSGEQVLDACCGAGASAVPAARLVGPTGLVDAVDQSAAMITRLQGRARSNGIAQLHPHRSDVRRWGKSDYDLVISVMGIFFLPEMTESTRTLAARCRPGGRVAFTIWRRGAMDEFGQTLADVVAAISGRPRPRRPSRLLDEINTAHSYAGWLRDLGLSDVTVDEHGLDLTLTEPLIWLLVTGSGFVGMIEGLSPAQVSTVRTALVQRLRGSVLDAGSLVGVGTWTTR